MKEPAVLKSPAPAAGLRYLRAVIFLPAGWDCVGTGRADDRNPRTNYGICALKRDAASPANDDAAGLNRGGNCARDLAGAGTAERRDKGVWSPAIAELNRTDVGLAEIAVLVGKEQRGRVERESAIDCAKAARLVPDFDTINKLCQNRTG